MSRYLIVSDAAAAASNRRLKKNRPEIIPLQWQQRAQGQVRLSKAKAFHENSDGENVPSGGKISLNVSVRRATRENQAFIPGAASGSFEVKVLRRNSHAQRQHTSEWCTKLIGRPKCV